jgi:hypothetical protein
VDIEVIWVKRERKYFCKRGWTGKSVICPSGQNQQSGTAEEITGDGYIKTYYHNGSRRASAPSRAQ